MAVYPELHRRHIPDAYAVVRGTGEHAAGEEERGIDTAPVIGQLGADLEVRE